MAKRRSTHSAPVAENDENYPASASLTPWDHSKKTSSTRGKRVTRLLLLKQLALLRKKVKQARVHVVSKLTKHQLILEKKKGSARQLQRNARKLKRLREEIQIAKKLKRDEVARYAVAETKDLEGVISNAKTPLEVRAKARIAMFPVLQEKLQKFRQRHPTWEKDVPKLLLKIKPKVPKSSSGLRAGYARYTNHHNGDAGDCDQEQDGAVRHSDNDNSNPASAKPFFKAGLASTAIIQSVQKKQSSDSTTKSEKYVASEFRENDEEGDFTGDERQGEIGSNVNAEEGSVAEKRLETKSEESGSVNGNTEACDHDSIIYCSDGRIDGFGADGSDKDKSLYEEIVNNKGEGANEEEAFAHGFASSDEEGAVGSKDKPDPDRVDVNSSEKLVQGGVVNGELGDNGGDEQDEDNSPEQKNSDDNLDHDEVLSEEGDNIPVTVQVRKRLLHANKDGLRKTTGQMKIKRIKLDDVQEDKSISLDEEDNSESEDEPTANSKRSSSFFMGGIDDVEGEDEEDAAAEEEDSAGEDVLMQGRRRLVQRQQLRASAAGRRAPRGPWRGAERGHRGRFQGRAAGHPAGTRTMADRFPDSAGSPDQADQPRGKLLRPGYLDGGAGAAGDDAGADAPRELGRGRGKMVDGFRGRGLDRGGRGGFRGGRGRFDRGGSPRFRGHRRGRDRGGRSGRGGPRDRGLVRGSGRGLDRAGSDGGFRPRGGSALCGARDRFDRSGVGSQQGESFVDSERLRAFSKGVHPSWAAKKSQSLSISKFGGRKIKFD